MTRIVLASVGSRGDVQPFVALGRCLRARGHAVAICTGENYQSWIEGHGLEFARACPDLQQVVLRAGEGVFNPFTFMRVGRDLSDEIFEGMLATCREFQAEVLVASTLALGGGTIAECLGLKLFWASFYPGTYHTDDYAFPLFPMRSRSRWLNRLTWRVGAFLFNAVIRANAAATRRRFGLQPFSDIEAHVAATGPVLLATDPLVAPVPGDWRVRGHATGYWFLDDRTPLPPDVVEFLEAGPRPIYVGFGSMPIRKAEARLRAIVEGVERAGARALISAGWAGLGGGAALPPSCKAIGSVSHALLFPRVAAVAHHCGAGTTAAALRAGVPQIPVPHGFDQFAWADRVHALGVAAPPLRTSFTGAELAAAIQRTTEDDVLIGRARDVGRQITASRGVEEAARLIEEGSARPRLLSPPRPERRRPTA